MKEPVIEIRKVGDLYRASIGVPEDLGIITGCANSEGLWAGGEGASPEEALHELNAAIGRAYVKKLLSCR